MVYGGEYGPECISDGYYEADGTVHTLNEPLIKIVGDDREVIASYPFSFDPTFHRYRLEKMRKDLQAWREPRTIFWGSMTDMFGDWVPDEWIKAVFEACAAAPQHRYLFLTKNPKRYLSLGQDRKLPQGKNMWYGSTATDAEADIFYSGRHNTFISAEPWLGGSVENIMNDGLFCRADFIIIGAMTGASAKKHRPEREHIESICAAADESGVPVFMKDSLLPIVGEAGMRRELPWE
jgi:protein gp37